MKDPVDFLEMLINVTLTLVIPNFLMLPNFLIVGAQKCGTTSLHEYLRQHPQIYLPDGKETKFFVDDERYKKGILWYEKEHFGAVRNEKAIGEIDPDYMYFEQALERMAVDLDLRSTKLIFVLRNPVDRAFSHYLMTVRRGIETLSFEEAIRVERERITKNYYSNMHFSYSSRGFYLQQIQRCLIYTGKTNMLFILSEDLKKNTMDVLTTCYNFLDVDEGVVPANIGVQHHMAKVPRSKELLQLILRETFAKKLFRFILPSGVLRKKLRAKMLELNEVKAQGIVLQDDIREVLSNKYSEDNAQLSKFIERDLSHWNYCQSEAQDNAG